MNKNLRDWLLARHDSASPRLDALRRQALPRAPSGWREILHELFFPHRVVWRTLAAVWIAVIAFHLTLRNPTTVPSSPPPSPEAVAAWFAQFKSHETFARMDRTR